MSKAEKLLYGVMYVLFTLGIILAIARNDYGTAIWTIVGGMWMHTSFMHRREVINLLKELENTK